MQCMQDMQKIIYHRPIGHPKMDQEKAIKILSREKGYEEKLVDDLVNYYLFSLYTIEDIEPRHKELIKTNLTTITHESIKHRYLFAKMIDMVLEHGKADY